MDEEDIIQEFLIESDENLARLDQEMVELERQPGNTELLASVFSGDRQMLAIPRHAREGAATHGAV